MFSVAVIPARGGSKGIPKKNLRLLGGMSLVARAIEIGQVSELIDLTVLTTDDEEIASVGREAGVRVIMRASELADDATPTIPVINHVLDQLKEDGLAPDIIVLLEPTSPFRTIEDVNKCIRKVCDRNVDSVITVTQLERNPNYIFSVADDFGEKYVKSPSEDFSQRQQFLHLKRLNGCVYATKADLIRSGRLVGDSVRVVEMSAERSINIDSPLDFELAELIAARVWR